MGYNTWRDTNHDTWRDHTWRDDKLPFSQIRRTAASGEEEPKKYVYRKVPFRENKYKTDVVAYLTLIGWLIAYFRGARTASRFHLNQALTLLLADFGLNAVFLIATLGGTDSAALFLRGVCAILSFCVMVLWAIGFFRATQGSERPVPILGEVTLLKQ